MAETENKVHQKDKKRLVKALFSYAPVNVDELQLKENDVLEVIEETEEGWWKGILNGNIGMFPSNFVVELNNFSEEFGNLKINELSPTKLKSKDKHVNTQEPSHDVAHSPSTKYDVKSSNLNTSCQNSVDASKVLEIDKKVSGSKKTVDTTAPRLPPKPVREQARVIYPYTAQNEDELSLKVGDIITVISKEVEDKGWWKGELNNHMGVFPDNFVQLIKIEEQKKPERPDKPSTALSCKVTLKSSSTDKGIFEFSPKTEKKVLKTPPIKPPPPEMHKKEIERSTPLFPNKKPQVPHPMKKPTRSSLGAKFSGFSSTVPSNSTKTPMIDSISAPFSPSATCLETKPESINSSEKVLKKQDETDNKDTVFDGLESCGKKLVHLTANRAKVPNRRPPSHIFLREIEKQSSTSASDPRRLSEPLLSEMKSLLQLSDAETHKINVPDSSEVKSKVPPTRPLPPSIKGNKPLLQGSLHLTKTIASEECIVKAPEPIKKSVLPDTSTNIPNLEMVHPRKIDICSSEFKPSSDKENDLRILITSMVSRNEFNEVVKQVKELKQDLEKLHIYCKKTINDLKSELELEKKQRQVLETELQHMKERQTT